MTLDYQYIDPGPDDPACTNNRYFALNVSGLKSFSLTRHSVLQVKVELKVKKIISKVTENPKLVKSSGTHNVERNNLQVEER